MYDRTVKEAKKILAFLFIFHLDCGKHIRHADIFKGNRNCTNTMYIRLEGKMRDLHATFMH